MNFLTSHEIPKIKMQRLKLWIRQYLAAQSLTAAAIPKLKYGYGEKVCRRHDDNEQMTC